MEVNYLVVCASGSCHDYCLEYALLCYYSTMGYSRTEKEEKNEGWELMRVKYKERWYLNHYYGVMGRCFYRAMRRRR